MAAPGRTPVQIRELRIELSRTREDIVDEISLEIRAGEVLGLVGESGSGKTTVGMALLGYCRPGGPAEVGDVLADRRDLWELAAHVLRGLPGGLVSYIQQNP